MNKRPALDLELLIPVLIGGFSVVGILAVLLIGRLLNKPAEIPATPSSTPFQYVYLGTEPAITTLVVDGSELPPTEEAAGEFPFTEEPVDVFPTPFTTSTRSAFPTPVILTPPGTTRTATGNTLRTPTPVRQLTVTRTSTASAANTYDDTDGRLIYSGSWLAQTGLSGPYQGTLHVSDVADNKSVTIQFSGQEIFFYYQPASSFGVVTIYLDDDPLALGTVSQSQGGGVWHYVLENSKTHNIRIEHTGGGSVNIDRFVIPAATPTPTRTPTP